MEIDVRGLGKRYPGGVVALDGIDLHVKPGMVGLLGANGAGKTTLMRILAGILRPSRGRVLVGGHDLARAAGRTAVKRALGYLPQDLGLYPDLTAAEFLDYIGLLKGMTSRRARRAQVGELLELTGLTAAAGRKLGTFSGGMRRRVGVAQALLGDPKLLIVDEPTAGLDPEERIRFRNLLATLASGRTVLLSTHIVEDVAQTCRELAVLHRGRLLYHGPTTELVAAAQGRVWTLTSDGAPPAGDGTVVAAVHLGSAVQYRVVGERPGGDAEPAAPTLEDGYVALMQQHRR